MSAGSAASLPSGLRIVRERAPQPSLGRAGGRTHSMTWRGSDLVGQGGMLGAFRMAGIAVRGIETLTPALVIEVLKTEKREQTVPSARKTVQVGLRSEDIVQAFKYYLQYESGMSVKENPFIELIQAATRDEDLQMDFTYDLLQPMNDRKQAVVSEGMAWALVDVANISHPGHIAAVRAPLQDAIEHWAQGPLIKSLQDALSVFELRIAAAEAARAARNPAIAESGRKATP